MSTTYGSIYYQEYKTMSKTGIGFFCIGIIMICIGIVMLAAHDDPEEESTATGESHATSGKVHPQAPEDKYATADDRGKEDMYATADDRGKEERRKHAATAKEIGVP